MMMMVMMMVEVVVVVVMVMTMMMLISRRRKMSMLGRMMLWRKTDPKTGKRTLCEPAPSQYMTCGHFQKTHFE